MPNIIVTGAASGLGKAFVTVYLKSTENSVIAVDKSFLSSPAQDVLDAADVYRKDVGDHAATTLRLLAIDVRDETQITTQLHDVKDVDLVIHSAGVRGLERSVSIMESNDVAKAETVDVMTAETMMDTFHINAVGTFLLVQALLPRLRPSSGSKVVIMGSRMGSMGSNTTGGGYAYRASKAALNAIVKSFSIDVPDVVFAIVHPGRVESGLVAVKEDGAISAEERGAVVTVSIMESNDVAEAETVDVMAAGTMTDTFHINAVGTFLLVRALLPKLRPSGGSKVVITRGYSERGGILDRAAAGEPGVRKAPSSQEKDEPAKSGDPKPSRETEVSEGIRRSLDLNHSRALALLWASPKLREEDESEPAILLSRESADNASSSSARMKKHRENSIDLGDEGDFPVLSSSP